MTTHLIERLGHRGDGIAPGPILAARTLPGEVVAGEVEGGRINRPEIVSPSPDRVAPACPHYAACGGCALMHARDDFVAGWKADVVRKALSAHGIEAKIGGVATSPPSSRRRATLSGRRTRKGAIVGFHGRATDTITPIPGCLVLVPAILGALPLFERMTALGTSRKGALSIAVSATRDGLDVAVTGGHALTRELATGLSELFRDGTVARLTWSGETVFQSVPPALDVAGIRVIPPPGAFLQATCEGEAALIATVAAITAGAARIVDLFSGCGTFALPLSRRAAVHAVEGDKALSDSALAAWRGAPGGHALTVETRDLFRRPLLCDELKGYDAVVIDPPRAGAEAQMREIARADVATVASVSCNPVSFARDAAILVAAGFGIDRIVVVDQFRWSPHVEIVAGFLRR